MFNVVKKRLYEAKKQVLLMTGVNNGLIVDFEEEIYEKMSHMYYNELPVSIRFKYLSVKEDSPLQKILAGRCFDNSIFIFFCFSDALLVSGDVKDLEMEYGKGHSGHFWVERGDYVYDPTCKKKFVKDVYYKIYLPTNIKKRTLKEYCSDRKTQEFYEKITSTTLKDMQPGGKWRWDLISIVPLFQELASILNNPDFEKELNDYLNSIQYDAKEVLEEFNNGLRQ